MSGLTLVLALVYLAGGLLSAGWVIWQSVRLDLRNWKQNLIVAAWSILLWPLFWIIFWIIDRFSAVDES